ncbi:hypothetical protein N801_11200 [Knoellia aerolata DSM 18566]|uniref:Glycosyltransferase RgtA/B/C/D-like domain-containing protein n=1 Tax=Knoellia aerolata DSM 18566 TaxID=1385519 RepID=A0A0A0K1K1_9MICO|nr:hypothetical protein N801_11200 [Knoellia aerolata DSM 18566]
MLGGVPFLLVLINFRSDVLRTAVAPRFASNFFDIQASAFLDGRLSVPNGILGIEGFVIDGQTFMYFPPFPAILRIPIQLVTHEFDGRLTVLSMALAWLVLAVVSTRFTWLVRDCLRPERDVSRTDAIAAAALIGAITGGTVLTFDASLPWVYHEVYLWASALAVGAAYWLLRVALNPTLPSTLWLMGFTLSTALTRTPGGWAMSGTVMALAAWLALRHARGASGARHRPRRRRVGKARIPIAVFAAGAVPLLASVTYNWVKFGHPYLFPLESQVWTQVNEHRRAALEANGGTITGPQFLETTLVNYFRPNGIRFVDYFPYITLPSEPAQSYGGAFLDQTYRTGSVTAFMPLLLLLSVCALVVLLRRSLTPAAAALRWPAVASLLVGGGVLGYGYIAHRYTSDFVPMLVVLGTIGLWHVTTWSLPWPRVVRPAFLVGMVGLTAYSIAAQMATGALAAAHTHRGDELTSFLSLQERLSGGPNSPVSRLVSRSDGLPGSGTADDLHITGDCAALYVHTGDQYEPWNLVEQRDMIVDLMPTFTNYKPGLLRLFQQFGVETREVSLEFDAVAPQARLVVEDRDGNFYSPWFEVARDRPIRVTAHARPEFFETRIRVNDDPQYDLRLPVAEWNRDWYSDLSQLQFRSAIDGGNTDHVRATQSWGPVPAVCGRLSDDHAVSVSRR